MIDNIVLLIIGTLRHRALNDLLPRCHPLGTFEQLGGIAVADTPAQLYSAVIVDTPLGTYFANRNDEYERVKYIILLFFSLIFIRPWQSDSNSLSLFSTVLQ